MARLCQPGGKANEGAGGAREREKFPGLKTAKSLHCHHRQAVSTAVVVACCLFLLDRFRRRLSER